MCMKMIRQVQHYFGEVYSYETIIDTDEGECEAFFNVGRTLAAKCQEDHVCGLSASLEWFARAETFLIGIHS